MNAEKRTVLGTKIIDLANIVAAALIVGQILSPAPFNWRTAFFGLVAVVVLYIAGVLVLPSSRRRK